MPRWRCVLLDLDGTLFDYRAAQESAVDASVAALRAEGLECFRAELRAFVDSAEVQAIESCRPGAPTPSAEAVARSFPSGCGIRPEAFLARYFAELGRQGGTIQGASGLLRRLRENGVRTAAVSNGPGPVQRSRLQRSGLMSGFEAVVISCEVGIAKPDPGIFGIALRLLGMPPSDSVMVGDSASSDMAGAGAASLDFVYFRHDGDFSAPGRRAAEASSLDGVSGILIG